MGLQQKAGKRKNVKYSNLKDIWRDSAEKGANLFVKKWQNTIETPYIESDNHKWSAMKFLIYVAVALTVVMHLGAQAQTSELESFLGRFQTYAETHYPKTKWTMPIAKPEGGSYSMPQAKVEGFMQDPKTGLRHYPRRGEVYDPQTGYYIEYDPEAKYQVDPKAGKIYKGEAEIEVKKKAS